MKDRASHVDWPRLLAELQYLLGEVEWEGSAVRIPVGTPTLARHLGVKRSTLVGWLDGGKIEYHQGCDLIAAWSRLSGKGPEFVPITVVSLSAARVR